MYYYNTHSSTDNTLQADNDIDAMLKAPADCTLIYKEENAERMVVWSMLSAYRLVLGENTNSGEKDVSSN